MQIPPAFITIFFKQTPSVIVKESSELFQICGVFTILTGLSAYLSQDYTRAYSDLNQHYRISFIPYDLYVNEYIKHHSASELTAHISLLSENFLKRSKKCS